MDLKSMVKAIFSQENLAKMAKNSGLEADQVKAVMGKAVPFLANADNKGKGEEEAIRAISEEAGVSEGSTKSVLTDMLPLLMGLMGGGTDSGSSLGGGSSLDSAFAGSAQSNAYGGNTLGNAFAGSAQSNAYGGNTLGNAYGSTQGNAYGGDALGSLLGGGSDLGGASGEMDMFSMLSSLFGGAEAGGMDMSDLFGGMFGGQGQELTVEQGSVPNPAPTVDQAFQQTVQQPAQEAQEEESAGGLLGLLGSLFGGRKN